MDRQPLETAERDMINLASENVASDNVAGSESQLLKKSDGRNSSFDKSEIERITDDVVQALKTVYDPEIPVDIYELGLIYNVELDDDRLCTVEMTLTAPGCPVAEEMPQWVETAVRGVLGIQDVKVEMTFDPPWTPERMSDEARLMLNMY